MTWRRAHVRDLVPGDHVFVDAEPPSYEVGSVELSQGRVQVTDTDGNQHDYHELDTVELVPPGDSVL